MPQPDAAGIAAALRRSANANYLGDPAVIDHLLRTSAKEILDRLDEVVAGRIPHSATVTADITQAVRLSRILTGKDPAYQPIGAWNTGDGLADAFRKKFGITEQDPTDAVEVGMVNFTISIRHAFRLHQDNPAADWKGAIDDALQIWSRLIRGLPQPRD